MQSSHFHAIAAMAQNRVIGRDNRIPWHLPEDFKWFRKLTWGKVILMGRKTFESIGQPLPGRTTLVLSRTRAVWPGVRVFSGLDQIRPAEFAGPILICGGSELYRQALPFCLDLFLTEVKQTFEGDAFFPSFEEQFELAETIRDGPGFTIRRFRNRNPTPFPPLETPTP